MSRIVTSIGLTLCLGLLAAPSVDAREARLSAAKVKRAVLDALRTELADQPGRIDRIKLRRVRSMPMPSRDASVRVVFREDDRFAGKVPVNVRIMVDGRIAHQAWFTAVVDRRVPVATAARRLRRGHRIEDGDLNVKYVDARRVVGRGAIAPQELVGFELKASVGKGRPVHRSGVTAPNVVVRGASVTIEAGRGALTVTAPGRVQQPGAMDDFVRVLNLANEKMVLARVLGPRRVLVGVR